MGENTETTATKPEEAMDALLGELANLYPNTVTKCHAVIARIEQELRAGSLGSQERAGLQSEIQTLKDENEGFQTQVNNLEDEIDDLQEQVKGFEENYRGETAEAVQAFLDECERVGPLRYDVPQTPRAMQAIVHLHDVVGRCA